MPAVIFKNAGIKSINQGGLMQKSLFFLTIFLSCFLMVSFEAIPKSEEDMKDIPLSGKTEECLECHQIYTPGIVQDWREGGHAHMTPAQAMEESELEREVSSQAVPENLLNVAVGCYECHSLNPGQHDDNFEHFDYRINVVVTPDDCATCHSEEKEQFAPSKKGNAHLNLRKNPVYHTLVETITSLKEPHEDRIKQLESSNNAKAETCYGCHGTKVEVVGKTSLETGLGEIEIPVLSNWPNQGVGRINPDGSQGACTACHPRHSFSIEIARKPDTCSQCHLEPDLPAWNVYRESKHGNIFYSVQDRWNWENMPWEIGKDFTAPTCAVCHNSLIVDQEGEVVAERSHDFGARLWVRIFGLIYSHPQPNTGKTFTIKNKDGLSLPTTFSGDVASEYVLDQDAQKKRLLKMKKVCTSCHSSRWAEGHFAKLSITNRETDEMVLAATQLLEEAWAKNIADKTNPFDEPIEQKWIEQWLFFANSIRYASAMAGPDYAAFKNGWWKLTKNLQEMRLHIDLKTASEK
jgi:hypothetical protein